MSVPKPIEPIHYDEPRAVMVRDPEDSNKPHSAVHGAMAIYVDSITEGNAVIAAWPVIIQAAADRAREVIAAVRAQQTASKETVP